MLHRLDQPPDYKSFTFFQVTPYILILRRFDTAKKKIQQDDKVTGAPSGKEED
jgi:hypothetical protein